MLVARYGMLFALAACAAEPQTGATAPAATSGTPNIAAAGSGVPAATGSAATASGASGAVSVATGAPGAAAVSGSAGAGAATTAVSGSAGVPAAPNDPTYTNVFTLLTGGCATGGYCHGAAGGLSKLSLTDKDKAYMELVGAPAMGMTGPGAKVMGGCGTTMLVRVKAGDPESSLLMQKLDGTPTCGDAMPPGGMLKPEELKLVHDWIAAGALNN